VTASTPPTPAEPDFSPVGTLIDALAGWLPLQRWWAGGARPVASITVEHDHEIFTSDDVHVRDLVLAVDHRGDVIRYQVPVTLLKVPDDSREHCLIGICTEGVVYDALHEPTGAWAFLALAAGQLQVAAPVSGTNRCEIDATLPGRWVGVEQSNTSVVYGDTHVLKAYRRLWPGTSPDLEVGLALTLAGADVSPEPLAWITGEIGGEATTLALVQSWLRGATDGWRLAVASVRDLFAEGDLHADEVGGDFAGDAFRLGAATARMHAALAAALPVELEPVEIVRATSQHMHERLDAALMEVSELAPRAQGLRRIFDAVATLPTGMPVQRIHGDLHLGQVLRTGHGWSIIDFEGEPSKPLEKRTGMASPLRDVAGMLRSLDYAAHSLLMEQPDRTFRAHQWVDRNRSAFCDGYASTGGSDPREHAVLLRAVEADKAVYEVVYEARHRPSWLPIPLAGVTRLVEGQP
jgi:maltokinase